MNEARTLRRRGCSLAEISVRYGISKSTASLWTRDVELSDFGRYRVARNRDFHRAQGHVVLHQKKLVRLSQADTAADELFRSTSPDLLNAMTALSMMYWCEGAKTDTRVAFTNSDPNLLQAFLKLLDEVFKIDRKKIRMTLQLHDYHDESEIILFWSECLRIPLDQFTKPFLKKSDHRYTKEGYKGCARLVYYDAHVARVLLAFAKKLIKSYIEWTV